MSDSVDGYLQDCKTHIEQRLPDLFLSGESEFATGGDASALARLNEACLYSLTNGGKRVRATLVYATAAALRQPQREGLDYLAGAVEMLHAYSLVHDDLPAMDDDDLRRGKPTCHIAFDEATAILVGDALQCRAFELLTELQGDPARQVAVISALAAAAGPRGMVGGQAIDLAAVNTQVDLATLKRMHQLKTGALIRGAILMAAHWCGASLAQRRTLDNYGLAIGLAFQVQDDILDIESHTDVLGKTQGADLARNKPTYPALLSLEGAKAMADNLHQQAIGALAEFGREADPLRKLADYIVARSH